MLAIEFGKCAPGEGVKWSTGKWERKDIYIRTEEVLALEDVAGVVGTDADDELALVLRVDVVIDTLVEPTEVEEVEVVGESDSDDVLVPGLQAPVETTLSSNVMAAPA